METVFRGIFTVMITMADTVTQTLLAINHLARGAKYRTEVVERKSVTSAALSELDNVNKVAERLEEIQSNTDGIGKQAFDNAEAFIQEYQNKRQDERPAPYAVRKARTSSSPDKKVKPNSSNSE